MDIKKLSWVLPIALSSFSVSTLAQGDSRSIGMGDTGVASANYLSSSFHNPARAVENDGNDHFGMIIPAIAVSAQNVETLMDKVDYFNEVETELIADPTNSELQEKWKNALTDLDDQKVNAQVNVSLAVSVPNHYLSTNLFITAQASSMVITNIEQSDIDSYSPDDSTIKSLVGGHMDVGLTFAKSFEAANQTFSVGISPKFQQLRSFSETMGIDNYDNDIDFDFIKKSAFNIDLGFNYEILSNLDAGLVAKNLLSHELAYKETSGITSTYQVKPQYIMAIAYNTNFYTVAMDIDLNSRQFFKEYENDLQFTNIGAEFNAWNWAQVRVGYKYSMTDYADNIITAGLGLTPFGKFGFDIAAQYGDNDYYGLAAQMIIKI